MPTSLEIKASIKTINQIDMNLASCAEQLTEKKQKEIFASAQQLMMEIKTDLDQELSQLINDNS